MFWLGWRGHYIASVFTINVDFHLASVSFVQRLFFLLVPDF